MSDFQPKSLVMIHFFFQKKKTQLKTNNTRQYQRSVKLAFLLLAQFSSFGNTFEHILVE